MNNRAPFLALLVGITAASGAASSHGLTAKFTPERALDLSLPRRSPGAQANPYINISTLEGASPTPITLKYTIRNADLVTRIEVHIWKPSSVFVRGLEKLQPGGSGTVSWNGMDLLGNLSAEGEYAATLVAYAGDSVLGTSSPTRFVIYRWRLVDDEGNPIRPGCNLMVNNDDDDLDGVADGGSNTVISSRDDEIRHIGFELVGSTKLRGVVEVTPSGPDAPIQVWSNERRSKNRFGVMRLLLEATAPGDTSVEFSWKTTDGFYLEPSSPGDPQE